MAERLDVYLVEKGYKRYIGFLFVLSSFYFHKSALFGIAVIFLSVMTLLNSKKIVRFVLFSFPILVFVTQFFLADFMMADVDTISGDSLSKYASKGQSYMERDDSGGSIGQLQDFLKYVLTISLLFLYINSKRLRNIMMHL